jgi:hypothetical protein
VSASTIAVCSSIDWAGRPGIKIVLN